MENKTYECKICGKVFEQEIDGGICVDCNIILAEEPIKVETIKSAEDKLGDKEKI